MPLDKSYIASHKAWDKNQSLLLTILQNKIDATKKDIELMQQSLKLTKSQQLAYIEQWRNAKREFNDYMKMNGSATRPRTLAALKPHIR